MVRQSPNHTGVDILDVPRSLRTVDVGQILPRVRSYKASSTVNQEVVHSPVPAPCSSTVAVAEANLEVIVLVHVTLYILVSRSRPRTACSVIVSMVTQLVPSIHFYISSRTRDMAIVVIKLNRNGVIAHCSDDGEVKEALHAPAEEPAASSSIMTKADPLMRRDP